MKKWLKFAGYVVVALFIVAQFFRPERSNPPTEAARTMQAQLQVPAQVDGILQRACQDCHSNNTVWPWYSNISPVSWFITNHVNDGRRHLNFSDWAKYDAKRANRKLEEIASEVEEGGMPLSSYLPLHSEARLSAEEIRAIAEWAKAERARMNVAPQEEAH